MKKHEEKEETLREKIIACVSQAWCTEKNCKKEMDTELGYAIVDNVLSLVEDVQDVESRIAASITENWFMTKYGTKILKPCPFCGDAPEIKPAARKGEEILTWSVRCKDLGCIFYPKRDFTDLQALIEDWNTRSEDEMKGSVDEPRVDRTMYTLNFHCGNCGHLWSDLFYERHRVENGLGGAWECEDKDSTFIKPIACPNCLCERHVRKTHDNAE